MNNQNHKCDPAERWMMYDARGIECGFVCSVCEAEKRRQYRPEIFTDSNYYADEPIDPEPGVVPDDAGPLVLANWRPKPEKVEEPPITYGDKLPKTEQKPVEIIAESALKSIRWRARPKRKPLRIAGPLVLSGPANKVEETREEYSETNITKEHQDAFNAVRDSSIDNVALFSCFVNGEPTAAIVAINENDTDFLISPLFVAVTESMRLTDHAGQSAEPCVECGHHFDDNPGSKMCATCEDWITTDDACIAESVGESPPPLYVRKPSGRYHVAEVVTIREAALAVSGMKHGDAIKSPSESEMFLKLKLGHLEHESFCAIFLDNRHRVIKFAELFRGTIDGTSVYPREVVKESLAVNAAAIIFAHNHPSGIAEPSQADERITKRLKSALELVDIRVLDHIIVGDEKTVSMASRGLL